MKHGPGEASIGSSVASTAAHRPARFMDSRCQRAAGIRSGLMMSGAALLVPHGDGHNCAHARHADEDKDRDSIGQRNEG